MPRQRCYGLSRVARMWLLWIFSVSTLTFVWIILAVLIDEQGKPLTHIVLWCLVTAYYFYHEYRKSFRTRDAMPYFQNFKNCPPYLRLHDDCIELLRLAHAPRQTSFYVTPLLSNVCAGVIGGWPPIKNDAIAVNIETLSECDHSERLAIIAHEISHLKTLWLVAPLHILIWICMLYGGIWTYRLIPWNADLISSIIAGVAGILFAVVVSIVLQFLVWLPFGRAMEYASDEGGVRITSPDDLIRALQKLYSERNEKENMIFSLLCRTHPPLEKRIKALEKLKSRLG